MERIELYNDHFQNFKVYGIPHAQLILADPPYNLGKNAYASNPVWYEGGDNKNGESELAGKEFFDTDKDFRPAEFMHFCSQMLVKEPKTEGKKSKAPCMMLFCAFEQLHYYIELGSRYGFKHYIPLVFRKPFSAQVLKANMKIVGNCEYGLILYKDKLPKFNNEGRMIFNCFDWPMTDATPKIHPTQKPVPLLERIISIFNDRNTSDVSLSFVIYSYPYTDKNTFTKDFFVHKRDSVMKMNIPGSKEGQYMATDAKYVDVKNITVRGEYALEARGLWYMENDMMGGPFVSHARVDRPNGRVVVVEAFVYAPEKKKRDLMRQLEASLYTLNLPQEQQIDEIVVSPNLEEVSESDAVK